MKYLSWCWLWTHAMFYQYLLLHYAAKMYEGMRTARTEVPCYYWACALTLWQRIYFYQPIGGWFWNNPRTTSCNWRVSTCYSCPLSELIQWRPSAAPHITFYTIMPLLAQKICIWFVCFTTKLHIPTCKTITIQMHVPAITVTSYAKHYIPYNALYTQLHYTSV